MITAYFVRHGQSKDNLTQVHQGTKSPLSPRGKKQASIVGKRLKTIKRIDAIYSSPFVRTKQTAKIISNALNKPIEYWSEIGEINNPTELIGIYYRTKQSRRIREIKAQKEINPDWKYSDEESFNEIKTRGIKILKHLEEKHQNQTVVCITHGTITKLVIALMIFGNNLKPKEFHLIRDTLKMGNTGLTKCKLYDRNDLSKKGWKILSINDMAHI